MINSKRKDSLLIDNLISILWPDFVETKSGLVFLKKNYEKLNAEDDNVIIEYSTTTNFYFDKTEEESSRNHIHLEDEIPIKSREYLVKVGMVIGEVWLTKLKKEFPNRHFRVYLNVDDSITVRFHQFHENEPEWLNEDDWKEEIKLGKIYIWKM